MARGLQALAVVVERDITIEGGELQGACGDGHDLGRVEDETDVVERGRDVAARGDEALAVRVVEGCFEGQTGEEGPRAGDEHL